MTHQPLIVIGMHRSGTSLIARLLHEAGVFMGADRHGQLDESLFFSRLNRFLFQSAHAEWDRPEPMLSLLDDPSACHAGEVVLKKRCTSFSCRGYLGWRRYLALRSLDSIEFAWGWKDPRNTYTLPWWLNLFPNARVLHVYRHGIDVAASLVARENSRRSEVQNRFRSSRCCHLNQAFDLWVEYVSHSFTVTGQLPDDQVIHLCYESFLAKPLEGLEQLASFGGVSIDESKKADLVESCDSTRAYAYRTNPELMDLYKQYAAHPLMRRLKYDQIQSNPQKS